MSQLKLVVFDMAGTTIRDEQDVESCFLTAAQRTNLNMSPEDVRIAQGWPKRKVFEFYWERQLGEKNGQWNKEVEASYKEFRQVLEQHYLDSEAKPSFGCVEVFEFLQKHNVLIALATGFYRKVTDIILDQVGWLEGLDDSRIGTRETMVQMSVASDEVENGKPAPDMIQKIMKTWRISDPQHVIMIGDAPADVHCGHNAGCLYSLAVTNGSNAGAELGQAKPHAFLSDLGELISFIEEKELLPIGIK